MTKHTARDDVTEALLETLAEHGEYESPTGVTIHDLTEATDVSRRTVLDVLKTYVDKGLLAEASIRGPTENGYRERTEYFAAGVLSPIGADAPDQSDTARQTVSAEAIAQVRDEIGMSNGDVSTQTHGSTDENPDAPASETTETDESDESDDPDARYVISCPDCEYQIERQQNSAIVKDTRERKRICPECEPSVRVELLTDNRPNPPICPECDEEVISVDETDDYTRYIHDVEVTRAHGRGFRELDCCSTSG
jgi:hypothetical protein